MDKEKKILGYWWWQIIGWGIACSYWVHYMWRCDCIEFVPAVVNIGLTFSSCILVTHLYRLVAEKYGWYNLDLAKLIPIALISIVAVSIVFWVINIFIGFYCYDSEYLPGDTFADFVKNTLNMFVTWVRLSAIWILAFYMYHFAKRGAEAERDVLLLNNLVTEASLNNLRAQLNPHFLFNALNSVKALINEDPEKAKRATVLLADILRNSLNISEKDTITVEEEVNYINDYLSLEQIRFEERLKFTVDVEPSIYDYKILPLSIFTLVENAFKHGINKLYEGGSIKVAGKRADDFLQFEVYNSGSLKNDSPGGIGLKNLRERLSHFYRQQASVTLNATTGNNVIAQLIMPVQL